MVSKPYQQRGYQHAAHRTFDPKPQSSARLVKFSGGGGLQLWIEPNGAKRWRLAYRFAGKQKLCAIGVYPDVGLKEAREARDAAKKVLAAGGD